MIDNFLALVSLNIIQVIVMLIGVTIAYWMILKRQIYNVFDPFMLSVVTSIFSAVVVIYMYFNNITNRYFFYSFILTEIAYLVGLSIVKPLNKREINKKCKPINSDRILYYEKLKRNLFWISSLIYVLSQLYYYKTVGIPLLMKNENMYLLAQYVDNGIAKRILDGMFPVVVYLLIDKFVVYKKKSIFSFCYDWFVAVFILVTMALSGYKANFIYIVFYLQLYKVYSYKLNKEEKIEKRINRFTVILFSLSLIMSLIIISTRYITSDSDNSIVYLFKRLLLSGDVFIYSYGSDVLQYINKGNAFTGIFSDILGLLRIVSWDKLPQVVGLQIFQIANNSNGITGPNPRHNVFGLLYFGYYGSIIYSFLIGLIINVFRNKIYYRLPQNFIGGIFYCTFVNAIIFANTDITSLTLAPVNAFIFTFIPLLLVTSLFTAVVHKNRKSLTVKISHKNIATNAANA